MIEINRWFYLEENYSVDLERLEALTSYWDVLGRY